MTPITATLLPPSAIRLDFAFDQSINAQIKAIPGWQFDGKAKAWTVPIRQLDALIARLGDALSLSYEVLQAVDNDAADRVRTFVGNALAAGISLAVQGGRVIGSGGAYTALWQAEIDNRAAIILSLHLAPATAPQRTFQPAHVEPVHISPDDERQAAMLINGMRNAAQNQYKQAQRPQRRKGKQVAA